MLDCIALVIGVGAYQHLPPINCAGFEAKVVFSRLKGLATRGILRHDQGNGFCSGDGFVVADTSRDSLLDAVRMFQGLLQERSGKCWAFFYYAGHGMTDGGSHFLIGSDAPPRSSYGICFEEQVLGPMRRHAVASLAVLDASRNPAGPPRTVADDGSKLTFDFGWGSSHGGAGWSRPSSALRGSQQQLPRATSPSGGAYVCWASSPYQPALAMSDYTSHLVKHLFEEKLTVLKAASMAFEKVEAAAGRGARGEMMGFIGPALVKPLEEWAYLDESLAATRSQSPGGSSGSAEQQPGIPPVVASWLDLIKRQHFKDVSTTIARVADVAALVKLLDNSPDTATRQAAARALWCLAVYAANTVTITQTGGIPSLVQLLASSETVEQQVAAGALAGLAMNDESEVAVAQGGAVPPLVTLLDSPDAVVRQRAALAIWELARNAANQAAIAGAGAIPALVKLLSSSSSSSDIVLQQNAAGALWHLAAANAAAQVAIAQAGGIPPLVKLLGSSDTVVQRQAAGAVANLAANAVNQAALAQAGAVPLLLRLQESSDTDVQEHARRALKHLNE